MIPNHHARNWGLFLGVLALPLVIQPAAALDLRSWDQQIDSGRSRFQVLRAFDNQAVLDKETQLVWERSPSTVADFWSNARNACPTKIVGGRKGWRLPSIHELTSLLDRSVTVAGPKLPAGHPFLFVQPSYWSATTDASTPTAAWWVSFLAGSAESALKSLASKSAWCVRGSQAGPDLY